MKFIPPLEIASKIMTLITEADKELILVSPYVKINEWEKRMIFSSRKVNELYQRYCRQVLKILRSPSYNLTGEECREIWDEIWKEAMRRKRELRKLKSEEERQSWILAVVKRKLEERKSKDKSQRL